MKNTFTKDLVEGQKKEEELAKCFLKRGYLVETTKDKGYFPPYDMKVKRCLTCTPHTIESKYDRMAPTTGNIAIEAGRDNNGKTKNSGLLVSEAEYYAYAIKGDDIFYLLSTKELKEHIKRQEYKRKVISKDKAILYLFSADKFKNYCYKLKK